MALSEGQASVNGDQPTSKKLVVAWVSRGKNVAVGNTWVLVLIPTWASMPATAWHTATRNATFTQSSDTTNPSAYPASLSSARAADGSYGRRRSSSGTYPSTKREKKAPVAVACPRSTLLTIASTSIAW